MYDNPSTHFLAVKKSVTGQAWIDALSPVQRQTALAISQRYDVPEIIGRVMASRGVVVDGAQQFLKPTIRELMPDPHALTDMVQATQRLGQAILNREKIAIFGDYDVDGACASALLSRFLTHFDIENTIYIPDRIFEGYGPNPNAIEELINNGAELIVTVDCGATSFEALERAEELGVDVVVIDHHQVNDQLPPCYALVNPNRQDDLSGLGHLCAAGVVFMVLVSVNRWLKQSKGQVASLPDLLTMLDLVALATICDVVPLQGLNRAFVITGLQIMRQQRNIGITALINICRLDAPPEAYHLGFLIGPRINAGGRIGDAALGARLLTETSEASALEIASQLDRLNSERQQAEKVMLQEAIAQLEFELSGHAQPNVLVTSNDAWHPGIVGLLASRLKDRFKKPTFAIAFDKNGKGSGSGRSIIGVDLGKYVRRAVDKGILVKGGGHAMAAGLTVSREKFAEFRDFMEEEAGEAVSKATDTNQLEIDGALTARSASIELLDLLEQAGPYGAGHSQPIFAFPAHRIQNLKIVGQDHVAFSIVAGDGSKLNAISFRSADAPLGQAILANNGMPMHVVGALNSNYWQGRKSVQLRVTDIAKPQL